ncbi:phage terminase large subunit [Bizionia psychrotolerans]|uniref:phage terminase large subunit n=1 Tax=Bizionia psychrotolerans TaxID=1492901 RepID=UPI0006504BB5|nr:phage terminase large subunit [Bizionia psychrotolerans]
MKKFQFTKTFNKIGSLKKPLRVVSGGQGAGKTIAILQIFILLALSKRDNLTLSIVAESLPNLKSGALKDFEELLLAMKVKTKFKINQTDRTFKCGTNQIEFFSVDGEASRLGSRRTHLYVNEADNIKLDTFLALQGRTSEFTIIDYNPRRKFWAHEHFIGSDDVDYISVTFLDNEYLPKGEINSILRFKKKAEETGSKFWLNKWKVYGLGELGIADGLIFENWIEAQELPDGAKYLGAGLDFGFSNDPTAIIKIYKYEDKIILVESLYKKDFLIQLLLNTF